MSYNITELKEEHWDRLLQFFKEFKEEKHPFFKIQEVVGLDKDVIFDGKKQRFIVLDGDDVIGYCFYYQYKMAEVTCSIGYGILERYKGRGISDLIIGKLHSHAILNGYRQFVACVASNNWRNVIVLYKHGYRVTDEDTGILYFCKRPA